MPASEPAATPMGVALIGAGSVVRSLYQPILTGVDPPFRVVTVYDVNPTAAAAAAAQLGGRVASSLAEAIEDAEVGAVFVCTPKEAHLDVVRVVASRGRHVLCEKPLGRNGEDARQMLQEATAARVAHMVNFVYRYRHGPATARRMLRAGALGEVYHVNGTLAQGRWFTEERRPAAERPNATRWRFGPTGGVLRDLGPHLIDMCAPLGEVEWVQGWAEALQDRPDAPEDVAGIGLGFAGGTIAHLLVSRWATGHWEDLSVQVSGSAGAVQFDRARAAVWTRTDPQWTPAPQHERRTFLDVFRGAIAGTDDDVPTFRDGLRNNLVLDAVAHSGASGQRVRLDSHCQPAAATG